MTWETVPLRGGSVSVSWRKPGGKGVKQQLCITLSDGLRDAIGLHPGALVVPQRDRIAGSMRLLVVHERVSGARRPRWRMTKRSAIPMLWVPMLDVVLNMDKTAQSVPHSIVDGALVIRLPHWACPLIQVSGRAA